ncbi:MAG: CsbD family protein [Casimicrobiaceae bacterium]
MNWDRIEGNWKQVKGKAKDQWGKLTDDQLDVIGGKRDQLVGKVQESYGLGKDEAEKQVNAFADRYNADRLPDDPVVLGKTAADRTTSNKF